MNRNEGLCSRLRDKLNRLYLRTKGYSKSIAMLSDSIALVCLSLKAIQHQRTLGIPKIPLWGVVWRWFCHPLRGL